MKDKSKVRAGKYNGREIYLIADLPAIHMHININMISVPVDLLPDLLPGNWNLTGGIVIGGNSYYTWTATP